MKRLLLALAFVALASSAWAQSGGSTGGSPGGGSGTVSSGLINQLGIYAAGGTTISGLATVANGVLVTDGSGVPSISTTLPAGLTIPSPTSLAINGCTIGTNVLCATGTANISGNTTVGGNLTVSGGSGVIINGGGGILISSAIAMNTSQTSITLASSYFYGWASSSNPSAAADLILSRAAPATLHHGAADAAAPVAQTIGVQGVVAGTSNTPGVLWTFKDSVGTGSGISGGYAFQVAPAGGSATVQNTYSNALTIAGGTGLIAVPLVATGTPVASLCIDASNNIIKKTTAGSCV